MQLTNKEIKALHHVVVYLAFTEGQKFAEESEEKPNRNLWKDVMTLARAVDRGA